MTNRPGLDNRIIIKTATQLSGTRISNVQYFIDGEIDLGTTQITVPTGGVEFMGLGFNVSKLYSTENNYTMFIDGGTAGAISFQGIELSASGTGSKLFDLDNNGGGNAIEFIDCNIGSFSRITTSFGNLDDYRQIRTAGCGFINYSDGFTLNGTFSGGVAATDSIILSSQSGSTLFKEGTNLVIQGSSTSNINTGSASNASNTIVWDFQESNIGPDGGFVLDGARFGDLTNPVPNLSETSTKAFFRDCVGIRNTRPGFELDFTSEVVTPLTEDILAKALGTTNTTNAVWWSQTGNNEVTYNSSLTRDFKITGNIRVDGVADDELAIVIRKWDSSASAYVDLKTTTQSVSNIIGQLDVADFNIVTRGEFEKNGRIELWLRNNDDGTDATVLQGSSSLFIEVI